MFKSLLQWFLTQLGSPFTCVLFLGYLAKDSKYAAQPFLWVALYSAPQLVFALGYALLGSFSCSPSAKSKGTTPISSALRGGDCLLLGAPQAASQLLAAYAFSIQTSSGSKTVLSGSAFIVTALTSQWLMMPLLAKFSSYLSKKAAGAGKRRGGEQAPGGRHGSAAGARDTTGEGGGGEEEEDGETNPKNAGLTGALLGFIITLVGLGLFLLTGEGKSGCPSAGCWMPSTSTGHADVEGVTTTGLLVVALSTACVSLRTVHKDPCCEFLK